MMFAGAIGNLLVILACFLTISRLHSMVQDWYAGDEYIDRVDVAAKTIAYF